MIIAVDTETRGLDTRKFVCGSLVTEAGGSEVFMSRTEMFNRIIEIIEKEKKRGKKTYVYAHNHEYDWYVYARDNWEKKGIQYLNFKPFIAIYKESGYFLDSYSLFRMSLDNLGKMIGVPKGVTHSKLFSDEEDINKEEMEEIIRYCVQDARIVLEAVLLLKERLGKLGYKPRRLLTSGQIAMSTFVSHLRREGLWWKLTNKGDRVNIIGTKFDDFVRTSFRGGRNEAYRLGEYDNITGLDINSLYPFIMKNMVFPDLRTEEMVRDPLSRMSIEDFENYVGFCECEIEIPQIDYGFLPIRYKKHLIFPNTPGVKMKSVWTLNEVTEALKLGYKLKKVSRVLLYKQGENIFEKYISKLYEERKKSEKAMGLVIKIMMNSLFGKFGQKSEKSVLKFVYRSDLPEDENWDVVGSMGSYYVISRKEEMDRRYFVNPVIPSLITSFAREYLFMHMNKIDIDDMLYCDTDSLMVGNYKRYKNLFEVGDEMGQWKMEFRNKNVHIKGEKKYRVEDIVKVSGIHSKNLNAGDFDKGVMSSSRMVSFLQGSKGFGEVGTFTDIQNKLGYGCKREIEIMEKKIHDKK